MQDAGCMAGMEGYSKMAVWSSDIWPVSFLSLVEIVLYSWYHSALTEGPRRGSPEASPFLGLRPMVGLRRPHPTPGGCAATPSPLPPGGRGEGAGGGVRAEGKPQLLHR